MAEIAWDESRAIQAIESCRTVKQRVELMDPINDEAWCNWFAGFCDGEAYFCATETAMRFGITLRDDDAQVLHEIADKLGVGNLHSRKVAPGATPGTNPALMLEISGERCLRVVEALKGRMRAKKARDFEIWSAAVLRMNALRRGSPMKRAILAQADEDLRASRIYRSAL